MATRRNISSGSPFEPVMGYCRAVVDDASLADVVRTRVHLVDTGDFDAVARAHGARFTGVRPATTTVVVAALLNPGWKVEIEAEAVMGAR